MWESNYSIHINGRPFAFPLISRYAIFNLIFRVVELKVWLFHSNGLLLFLIKIIGNQTAIHAIAFYAFVMAWKIICVLQFSNLQCFWEKEGEKSLPG